MKGIGADQVTGLEPANQVDRRITSASTGDLPQSAESPESQNPHKIETSQTEEDPEDP